MQDHNDPLVLAIDGHVKELAAVRGCSLSRMYEYLGKDSPYPKIKQLIRDISQVNKDGVRIIQADLTAFFQSILGDDSATLAEFHKECSEAVSTALEGKPITDQIKETRDVVAIATKRVANLERCLAPAEDQKKFEAYKQNGDKR
jgi:hypothetical protein